MSLERVKKYIRKNGPANEFMRLGKQFQLVVIGGSAGATEVIIAILGRLPADFGLPVVIVKHISPDYRYSHYYTKSLNERCRSAVKEADQGEAIMPGVFYLAPPNYHLLIEKDRTFSLSIDEKVKFCRPAIDVLFETAADAYCDHLIGILLSGANDDGANGLKRIKGKEGYTIVQDPGTADVATMPRAAINVCKIDAILTPKKIVDSLMALSKYKCEYSEINNESQ